MSEDPQTGFGRHSRLPDTAGARLQFPDFYNRYKGFSGSVGFTFSFTDRVLIKGNVARGYRAPNINEIGSNRLDPGAHIVYLGNRSFGPEFSLQEDIGLMANLKEADISIDCFNNYIDHYILSGEIIRRQLAACNCSSNTT